MMNFLNYGHCSIKRSICIILLALTVPAITFNIPLQPKSTTPAVPLKMGLLDSMSNFLNQRDGDFIKLEEAETAYGPGPALLLYKVPLGIDNDEIQDMLSDSAPMAFEQGIKLAKINDKENSLLQYTVENALKQVVSGKTTSDDPTTAKDEILVQLDRAEGCPVLFFSGFDNSEMMASYNLLGSEIYKENGETAACAKAVPNAMSKPLKQVVEEISGDHSMAMGESEKTSA